MKHYFLLDCPLLRHACVTGAILEDAHKDLQNWISRNFPGSGSRVVRRVNKPKNIHFGHQYGSPEWLLVPMIPLTTPTPTPAKV